MSELALFIVATSAAVFLIRLTPMWKQGRTTMNGKIEKKVSVASVATYLGALAGLAILQGVGDLELVAALPDVLELFVAPLVPAAVSFLSGYVAPHTERTDLR